MHLGRFIYGFILLLLVRGAAKAQPPSSEPIFGMLYDAKSVHFEQAPQAIIQRCEKEKSLKSKPFWIFAQAKFEGTEYFIMSNRTTEDSGAGYIARGSECVEWLPERMMEGESTISGPKEAVPKWAPLTEPVLKALAQDVFRRYTHAFGGKKNFLDAVKKGGLAPKDMPRVLREQLAAFSREP
jgi:hypothetical protein